MVRGFTVAGVERFRREFVRQMAATLANDF
jgi:hypothetical protein